MWFVFVYCFPSPSYITITGASVVALRKQEVVAGSGNVVYIERKTGGDYGSLLPADVDGFIEPPTGSPCPLIEIYYTTLNHWTMAVNWAAGTASLTLIKREAPAVFNQLCPGYLPCIPQPRKFNVMAVMTNKHQERSNV